MSSPQIRKLVNKRKQTTIESSFLPDPDHPGANLQLSHNGPSESLHRQPSFFLFFCSPWEQFLKLTQAVSFWVRGRSRTLKKTHGITIVNHHLTVRSSLLLHQDLFSASNLRAGSFLSRDPRSRSCVEASLACQVLESCLQCVPLPHSQVGPRNANTQQDASRTFSLSNG